MKSFSPDLESVRTREAIADVTGRRAVGEHEARVGVALSGQHEVVAVLRVVRVVRARCSTTFEELNKNWVGVSLRSISLTLLVAARTRSEADVQHVAVITDTPVDRRQTLALLVLQDVDAICSK